MALNILQGGPNKPIVNLGVECTYPTTPVAGGACLFGVVPGVAENDEDADGRCVINTDCIAELVVSGTNGGGNVAVTAGDQLYASQADPVVISKVTTGVKFGVAYGNKISGGAADVRTGTLVASGATTTAIRVWVGKIS